jgi:hypothetical protein
VSKSISLDTSDVMCSMIFEGSKRSYRHACAAAHEFVRGECRGRIPSIAAQTRFPPKFSAAPLLKPVPFGSMLAPPQ